MRFKTGAMLLVALYVAALAVAYLTAPAALWHHVAFYLFMVVFAAVALGGVMLFDAHALQLGRSDDSTAQEVEILAQSAAGGWFAALFVAGTVLLVAMALVGVAT